MDCTNEIFFIQLYFKYVKFRPRLVAVIYILYILSKLWKYTGYKLQSISRDSVLFSAQSKTSGTKKEHMFMFLQK